MLNKREPAVYELIWGAVARLGRNAGQVADDILGKLYPNTLAEAVIEGADKTLRSGFVEEVKRVLRSVSDDGEQRDFDEIDPGFQPIVKTLKSATYFVPSLNEQVPITLLIANPALLDEARRFMRQKGEENLAEATKLDQLYAAVIAPPTGV